MVYFCINLAVTNSWIEYKRPCKSLNVPKKDIVPLIKFQCSVAFDLINLGKSSQTVRRDQPSSSSAEQLTKRPKTSSSVSITEADVCCDEVAHTPVYKEKQSRCRLCSNGYTFITCSKCFISLCLTKCRNCFISICCWWLYQSFCIWPRSITVFRFHLLYFANKKTFNRQYVSLFMRT